MSFNLIIYASGVSAGVSDGVSSAGGVSVPEGSMPKSASPPASPSSALAP